MSSYEEKRQLYENFFKDADVNGDGKVTIVELRNVLRSKFGESMSDAELADTCVSIDADGDMKITLDEFLNSMLKKPRKEAFEQTFRDIDKGNTGILKREQLSEFCQKCAGITNPAVIEDMFNEADKNKDGFIDFNEFMQLAK